MRFSLEEMKNMLKNAEFYNFPADWACNGLAISHISFTPGNIVLVREEGETRGISINILPKIVNNVSAIVTGGDISQFLKFNKPIIKVNATDEFVFSMGEEARSKYNGTVIAITGSCGKTTCSNIMKSLVDKFGANINASGNTRCGISWNMTTFDLESKYWVIETSLGGRMIRNSHLVKPKYAIVTNIAPVHLEGNQDISFIALRKSEIFASMKPGNYAILYRGMEKFDFVKNVAQEKQLKVITYGENDADVIVNCEKGNNFIQVFENKFRLNFDVVPKHILMDMAAAAIVAYFENIDAGHVLSQLNKFEYISGRGEVTKGNIGLKKHITIIDEAYNANPISMKCSMEGFGLQYPDNNSQLLILGDMVDGGRDSIKHHIYLADTIKKINPSRILFCGELMKYLYDYIKTDFKVQWYAKVEDLNKDIFNWIKDGDNIFIKSSNSIKLETTVELLKDRIKDYEKKNILEDISISRELEDTKTKIKNLFANHPSFIPSIFVWEYSKQVGLEINSKDIYPCASIIKIGILIALLKQIYEDKILNFWDKMVFSDKYLKQNNGSGILKDIPTGGEYTLDYLAEIMISESDNIASNMLLEKIGGISKINEIFNSWGLENIFMQQEFPDLSAKNQITAYDISKLLYNIDNEKFIKKEYAQIIKNYLLLTKNDRYLKKRLPEILELYHITGSCDLMMGDSGIIRDKNNNLQYIISVLVKIPYVRADRDANIQARKICQNLIQQTSLLIYEDLKLTT